jgi:hypothetical protein
MSRCCYEVGETGVVTKLGKTAEKCGEPEGTAKIDAISKHRARILTSAFYGVAGLFAEKEN